MLIVILSWPFGSSCGSSFGSSAAFLRLFFFAGLGLIALGSMVQYCVYKASFNTRHGSRRHYIGMTGNPAQRESDLQTPGSHQPAWLKAGCHNFAYNILVKDIPSKAAALATEAFATAREWKWAPDAVRGGPWVKPTLTSKDVTELTASSKCNSIPQLLDLGIAKESGHLGVHLRGVSLTLADTRPRNTERSRQRLPIPPPRILAAITKKKNIWAKRQIRKIRKIWEKIQALIWQRQKTAERFDI